MPLGNPPEGSSAIWTGADPGRTRQIPVAGDDEAQRGNIVAIEVRIQRVHVHDNIRMEGTDDHIDPDAWRPLIMSFQKLYGLGPQVHPSTLARIPERMYRGPDIERARKA